MPSAAGGRFAVVAIVFASAFGLAACGSSDDSSGPSGDNPSQSQGQSADQQAIIALGQKLRKAYDSGDAAAACALLDPSDLKQVAGGQNACEKRVTAAIKQERGVPEVDFDKVTVDGDTAIARADSKDGRTTYSFVRIDGEWYIDLSPDDESSGISAGGGK